MKLLRIVPDDTKFDFMRFRRISFPVSALLSIFAIVLPAKESTAAILQMVPMPLNGIAQARSVAYILAWLASEENTHLCGQCVFIDGGSDAVLRGDSTW